MLDFAHPERLWLLLTCPFLAFWTWRGTRRRASAWLALGRRGKPQPDGGWRWVAAIAVLILALAQPRWGRRPGADLPPGHDLVLSIDVSRSMAAEDAVPNRL